MSDQQYLCTTVFGGRVCGKGEASAFHHHLSPEDRVRSPDTFCSSDDHEPAEYCHPFTTEPQWPSPWVPVTERLPRRTGRVLAAVVGVSATLVVWYDRDNAQWQADPPDTYTLPPRVTHWMPLPPPPGGRSPRHASVYGYANGCRCEECRAAMAAYVRDRRKCQPASLQKLNHVPEGAW